MFSLLRIWSIAQLNPYLSNLTAHTALAGSLGQEAFHPSPPSLLYRRQEKNVMTVTTLYHVGFHPIIIAAVRCNLTHAPRP